jgi:hypothetical protein
MRRTAPGLLGLLVTFTAAGCGLVDLSTEYRQVAWRIESIDGESFEVGFKQIPLRKYAVVDAAGSAHDCEATLWIMPQLVFGWIEETLTEDVVGVVKGSSRDASNSLIDVSFVSECGPGRRQAMGGRLHVLPVANKDGGRVDISAEFRADIPGHHEADAEVREWIQPRLPASVTLGDRVMVPLEVTLTVRDHLSPARGILWRETKTVRLTFRRWEQTVDYDPFRELMP